MRKTIDLLRLKRPKTNAPILPVLEKRFSPRFFSPDPIPEKDLQSMFEAARWAPSGYNNQPWYFYWTRSGEKAFFHILTTLPESNQWSKTTAVFVITCYILDKEKDKSRFALYDLGASAMTLVTQAQALGYYCRQIGIFDKDKLLSGLPIAKGHIPFVIMALGKLGDYRYIDDALWKREYVPRKRKDDLAKKL